jgi:hypothetical protein
VRQVCKSWIYSRRQLQAQRAINLLGAKLHPEGMGRQMTNLEEVAPAILAHLRDDASVMPEISPCEEHVFAADEETRRVVMTNVS